MSLLDSIERAGNDHTKVTQAAFLAASLAGNHETFKDVVAVRGNVTDWTTPVTQLRPPFSLGVAWTGHAVHVVALDKHDNSIGIFHVPLTPDRTDTRFCTTCGTAFRAPGEETLCERCRK